MFCLSNNVFVTLIFFFKRKTAYDMRISDWSSDVCSSDLEGTTLRSGVSNELTYDTRDSRFDPHEGFISSLRTEVFGLGGDVSFLRGIVSAGYSHRKSVV